VQDSTRPSERSLSWWQERLARIYLDKDAARGPDATFMYLVSEVGELAEALRKGRGVEREFADVAAWLLSLANLAGVDLAACMEERYSSCPHCGNVPCSCVSKP